MRVKDTFSPHCVRGKCNGTMFTIFYIAFSLYEISDLLNNIGYIILKYESNWVLGINMLINEAANLLWYIGRLVGWLLLVGRRYDLSDVDIILHFTLSCLYITHTGYTLHLPITTGASTSKMEQMFYTLYFVPSEALFLFKGSL